MSLRSHSSESAFPEPFSARRARDAEADPSAGDLPPPFRVGGEESAASVPDASREEQQVGEQEDVLPWLVTRDEAGGAPTLDAPAGDADPFEVNAHTDEKELEPGGGAVAPLPDWLDLEVAEDEALKHETEAGSAEPVEANAGWPAASPEEGAPDEGEDATFGEAAPPPLAEADEPPNPTPPAGTSVLAGGLLDQPDEEAAGTESREPDGEGDAASTSALAGRHAAAAQRLEEIASWLRDADLEQELEEADERGMRLFLAGVVLGREGVSGR